MWMKKRSRKLLLTFRHLTGPSPSSSSSASQLRNLCCESVNLFLLLRKLGAEVWLCCFILQIRVLCSEPVDLLLLLSDLGASALQHCAWLCLLLLQFCAFCLESGVLCLQACALFLLLAQVFLLLGQFLTKGGKKGSKFILQRGFYMLEQAGKKPPTIFTLNKM